MDYDEVKEAVKRTTKDIREEDGNIWCAVHTNELSEMLKGIRDEGITDLLSISPLDTGKHIDIIYHFSFGENEKDSLHIRVSVSGNKPEIHTITDIYPAATILEREAFEMFGIDFTGHPNLKRAFLDKDSPKNPLLKGKT